MALRRRAFAGRGAGEFVSDRRNDLRKRQPERCGLGIDEEGVLDVGEDFRRCEVGVGRGVGLCVP